MTRAFFVAAAAFLIATPAAFAQPAGGGAASGSAGAATGSSPGPSTAPSANVPGVATGVQPYRPAGAGGASSAAGVAGPTDTSVSGQINATLQAGRIPPSGQIPASDAATVGGASVGQGRRMPNPSTGTYTGPAGPTYGPRGATPYAGPPGPTSRSTGGGDPPGH